jgi:hypothetical protein
MMVSSKCIYLWQSNCSHLITPLTGWLSVLFDLTSPAAGLTTTAATSSFVPLTLTAASTTASFIVATVLVGVSLCFASDFAKVERESASVMFLVLNERRRGGTKRADYPANKDCETIIALIPSQ